MRADWAKWNEIVYEVTFLIITSVQKISIFVSLCDRSQYWWIRSGTVPK